MLELAKAFVRIKDEKVRRRLTDLLRGIVEAG
jgi:hypothetical protein